MQTKIDGSFWDDENVGKLADKHDTEALLALLWLMTARPNSAGWVEFSQRLFIFHTGASCEALGRACEALGKSIVRHEKGFWLRHYIRYQLGTGENMAANNIAGSVVKSFQHTPPEIVAEVLLQYPELKARIKTSSSSDHERPSQGLGRASRTAEAEGEGEGEGEGKESAERKTEIVFPDGWSPARRQAVQDFLAFRRKIKKPLKPASFTAWVRKYAALDDATLVATIETSMANGWQGLFPEQVTLPRPRREGAWNPAFEKKGGGGPAPAAHPLAAPPCAEWKAIYRALVEEAGTADTDWLEWWERANWDDVPSADRQAIVDEVKRRKTGEAAHE